MHRFVVLAVLVSLAPDSWADPPPPARAAVPVVTIEATPAPAPDPAPAPAPPARPVGVARVDVGVAVPPPAAVVASGPRFTWAPAPQPSFGQFSAGLDVGGGVMQPPAGTPVAGGGWELGAAGGWGPTRFAELRLRGSFFVQADHARDANGDQQDDVDEQNLVGMFLGGGLRLRLPLYAGVDEKAATRFLFFGEGLAGYQPLFTYSDVVSSGPAFEVTSGVEISHVRRRDGLTRGVDLFVRYRRGLGDGNRDLYAVLFGLGYTTEWSAFVPRVPPPPPPEPEPAPTLELVGRGTIGLHGEIQGEAHGAADGEAHAAADGQARGSVTYEWTEPADPGEPLGFSLRMGGECAWGEGWHVAKTIGWSPWRLLELQLQTSYFSVSHVDEQSGRDEPNVHGFFGGVGPRLHLYADNGLRVGLWTSAKVGWAQVVASPDGRDGTGLAMNVALGASFGGTNRPYSTTDVSVFVARQIGLSGNDDDIGMWVGGLAFDYELGPHAVPPSAPEPAPSYTPPPVIARREPEPEPPPVAPPVETVRTRTELVVEPLRPARPWPVGFAVGAELGLAWFPRRVAGGFKDSGLDLGLGVGFVASPYFELRSRVGLLTRSDVADTEGDDIEAVTVTGGPRVRIPIRTVKDNQVALILEAMGGWASTMDPAGSALGDGAILEGAVGVRLPARGGLTVGARGLWPLSDEARGLTSVQFTFGGELEMGPRFRRPVTLPEIPRVEVPDRVEVDVR